MKVKEWSHEYSNESDHEVGCGVVAAIALAFVGLSIYANRALHDAYAALEADGRPMKPEQIIPSKISDADNAALVYEAVILKLKAEKL